MPEVSIKMLERWKEHLETASDNCNAGVENTADKDIADTFLLVKYEHC